MAASPALAQQIVNGLGGFSTNPDAPIDITADRLDVDDIKKHAIFRGKVKAVQGDFVLHSKLLNVFYSGNAQGSGTQITRLKAEGDVRITSRDDQTATSDWANFEVQEQRITIGDCVVLTQGDNVIKGERLVINLKTGQSHFEPTGKAKCGNSGGRIRMLIRQEPRESSRSSASPVLRGGGQTQ